MTCREGATLSATLTRVETAFAEPGYGVDIVISPRGAAWSATVHARDRNASGDGATIEEAIAAALDARDAGMPVVRSARAMDAAVESDQAAVDRRFRAVVAGLGVKLLPPGVATLAWTLAWQKEGAFVVSEDVATAVWNTKVGTLGRASRASWAVALEAVASRASGERWHFRPNAKAVRALADAKLISFTVAGSGKNGQSTLTVRPDVLAAFVAAGLVGGAE